MLVLFSCGIDELIYLEPVESSYVTGVTSGYVRLPDNNSNIYFQNYIIYYRIYTSNSRLTSINPSNTQELRNINPSLESDYNSLNSYITNENTSTSGMDTIFENRGYYHLYTSTDKVNEIAMENLLSPQGYQDSQGNQVIPGITNGLQLNFDFNEPFLEPFMSMGIYNPSSIKLNLFRVSNKFTVIPDRLFFLSNDLTANVTGTINKDVQLISNADSLYAYVSLYIIASGINNTFSSIYSRPRHIGIFLLPSK